MWLFKNILLYTFIIDYAVKGFGIVFWYIKQRYMFSEFPSLFYDPTNVGNLIFCSSSFPKSSLDIWKLLIHKMLKPSMQGFKHDATSMGDECKRLRLSGP